VEFDTVASHILNNSLTQRWPKGRSRPLIWSLQKFICRPCKINSSSLDNIFWNNVPLRRSQMKII